MDISANSFLVFVAVSSLMALGIGLDAAIATFARYPSLKGRSQKIVWVAGVSLTHTVFPMIGYLLAVFSVHYFPLLTPLIGIVAFVLVFHFLYEELVLDEQHSETTQWITFAIILTVSWDALWSGPAKSAQVIGWADWMIWLSFFWVGLCVLLMCLISCYLSQKVISRVKQRSWLMPLMSLVQYSVIAYFGILALCRFTLQWPIHEIFIFISSFLVVILIRRLNKNHVTEGITA